MVVISARTSEYSFQMQELSLFSTSQTKKNVPLLNRKQKLIAILDVCQAMLMITIKYPYTHYRERTTLPLFLRQFLWLNAQSSVLNEFFSFTQIVSTLISNLIAIKLHWKKNCCLFPDLSREIDTVFLPMQYVFFSVWDIRRCRKWF